MQETWVQSLGQEDALEKGTATYSSVLDWKTLWTEEPGGLQSNSSQRVGHCWMTNTHTYSLPAILNWFTQICVKILFGIVCVLGKWWVSVICSVVSDYLQPHRLYPTRQLCLWNHPARILEWVAILFSRGSSQPRKRIQVSCTACRFSTIWAAREALILDKPYLEN